jgi:hypothetical protein
VSAKSHAVVEDDSGDVGNGVFVVAAGEAVTRRAAIKAGIRGAYAVRGRYGALS